MHMRATRTVRIQLQPTPTQAKLLHQTMQEYTACFNEVCQLAETHKISNGLQLHRLTYAEHRATTHLPAQLICAVRYDARSFRFDRDTRLVSLVHVQQPGQIRNRATSAVKVPAYYEQYLTPQWHQESADLIYRKGTFWLHMVVSCEQASSLPAGKAIGVDLGINRLAVTSHPHFFGGKHLKETNNRYFRLRRKLQAKGTKSAKRHLKQLSGRLKRFQADANHVVSKRISSSCQPGDNLVMEHLTDIRERVKGRRQQRRAMSNWSFSQLQRFLAYKAAYRGISIEFVDARYSSQACSRCGYIANETERVKANSPVNSAAIRTMLTSTPRTILPAVPSV